MQAAPGNNGDDCDSWLCGNIIVDRDIYDSGGGRDYGISINSAVDPGVIYFGTGVDEHQLRGATDVRDEAWHHVAVTRVRSSGEKCLYVDGMLDVPCEEAAGDVDLSYPDGYTGFPNDPYLVVGAEKHDAGAAYPSFHGTLDELRIWNKARTGAEIAANKNLILGASEPGLVLAWHLDSGSGTAATDSSGDGNNGTVITGTPGSAQWVFSFAPLGYPGTDYDGEQMRTVMAWEMHAMNA
jgi:hypothetical protein